MRGGGGETWTNSLNKAFNPLGPMPTPVSATSKKTHFDFSLSKLERPCLEVDVSPLLS